MPSYHEIFGLLPCRAIFVITKKAESIIPGKLSLSGFHPFPTLHIPHTTYPLSFLCNLCFLRKPKLLHLKLLIIDNGLIYLSHPGTIQNFQLQRRQFRGGRASQRVLLTQRSFCKEQIWTKVSRYSGIKEIALDRESEGFILLPVLLLTCINLSMLLPFSDPVLSVKRVWETHRNVLGLCLFHSATQIQLTEFSTFLDSIKILWGQVMRKYINLSSDQTFPCKVSKLDYVHGDKWSSNIVTLDCQIGWVTNSNVGKWGCPSYP